MSLEITFGVRQKVYVSHVASDGIIFLQLYTKEVYDLENLSKRIKTYAESSGATSIDPQYGIKCFARSNFDHNWYRGLIANVSGSRVTVFYVDYGNTEDLTSDWLRDPVGQFFETPYQSMCCTTANFISQVTELRLASFLSGSISDHELYCSFISHSSTVDHSCLPFLPCYNVLLFESEKSSRTLADEMVEKGIGHLAICAEGNLVGSKQNVYVSYSDSPGKFWVQLSKRTTELDEIVVELNKPEVVATLKPVTSVPKGAACCCQYEDGVYYRAEIVQKSCPGSKVMVWFGDYGNTKIVPVKDVFFLPRLLTHRPFCSLLCGLDGVLPVKSDKPHPKLGHIAWTPKASKSFSELTLKKEFMCHFVSELSPDIYTIQLIDPETGRNIRQSLATAGIVELVDGLIEERTDFEYLSLEVGKTYHKIFITHAVSPWVVWCQLPDHVTEFDDLVSKLLTQGPSFPFLSNPENGRPCCVQYDVDQSWSRGLVESVDQLSQTADVLYVDFGNTEVVSLNEMKVLPGEFMVFPAQGLSFSLATVSPRNGDDWTEKACKAFKSLVEERELTCKVTALDADDYPAVILLDPLQGDRDISQELVHRGYAKVPLPSTPTTSGTDSAVTFVPSGLHPGFTSPRQAPSARPKAKQYSAETLEYGCNYEVSVCHVESLAEFYCQVLSTSEPLDELMAKISDYCTSRGALSVTSTTPGLPILAQYSTDGVWYRAVLRGASDEGGYHVKFVDYGNSEVVSKSCLREMSDELMSLPSQAVQCSLYGGGEYLNPSEDALQYFVDKTLENQLSLSVKDRADGDKYSVELYEADNLSILDQLVELGLLCVRSEPSVTPQPLKSTTLSAPSFKKCPTNVVASYVETPMKFYLQLVEYCDRLQSLTNDLCNVLSEQSDEQSSDVSPSVGEYCAAKSSEDNVWYRAKITNASRSQVEVVFIDFGNSEELDKSSIRALSPCFTTLPFMAVPCCLDGLSEVDIDEDICKRFLDMVLDKELSAEFLAPFSSLEQAIPVRLVDENMSGQEMNITEMIKGKQFTKGSGQEMNITEMIIGKQLTKGEYKLEAHCPPPLGTPVTCFVSYVSSCAEFYCQLASDSDELATLMEELNNFYSEENSCTQLDSVSIGSYCAAPYSDGSWYRGLITNAVSNDVTVFYIDYGNSEIVPLSNLRKLDAKFYKLSIQPLKCCLQECGQFSPKECTQAFQDAVLEQEATVTFIKQSSIDSYEVRIQVGQLDIREMLVGKSVQSPVMHIECVTPVLNTPVQCSVSFIDSNGDFYCQLSSDSAALTGLMDDMYAYYSEQSQVTSPLSPTVGSYCAAPYTDGSWYRGRVTAVSGQEVTVLYIDYGNSEVVPLSHLCGLEACFCSIASQSVKCVLSALPSSWDEQSIQLFQETVLEQEVDVNFIKQDGSFEVTVCKNGVDVYQSLFGKVEASQETQLVHSPKVTKSKDVCVIQTVSPPLQTPTQCTVSHVTSCAEFYCQLSSDSEQYGNMMNDLYVYYEEDGHGSPLSEPAVGLYCAAPFSDDGSWYRGVVTDVNPPTAVVFYMDYGNTGEVGVSDLRQLESQFFQSPIQAVLCCVSKSLDGEDVTKAFMDAVLEKTVEVVFENQLPGGAYAAQIKVDGASINKTFMKAGTPKELSSSSGVGSNIHIPPVLPECGPTLKCLVSYVVDCGEFYCQLSSESERFDSLIDKLYSFYGACSEGKSLLSVTVGTLCAAPYTDGSWYRGTITGVSSNNAHVWYLDYGNSDTVSLPELKELEPQFCGVATQGIKCHLKGFSPVATNWSVDCSARFQELILENDVMVTFDDQLLNGSFPVILSVSGQDVSQILTESKLAKLSSRLTKLSSVPQGKEVHMIQIQPFPLDVGSTCETLVTSVISPSEFYCQVLDTEEQLDSLMVAIGLFCKNAPDNSSHGSWSEGEFVLACYSEDTGWYRAQILNVSTQGTTSITVHYVDYGNQETVTTREVKKIIPRFSELPVQAIKCSLEGSHNFSYNKESWTDLVLNQEMEVKFVSVLQEGTFSVDLIRKEDGVDMKAYAIKEKIMCPRIVDPTVIPIEQTISTSPSMATSTEVEIALCFPKGVTPESFHDVLVQCVETPSLFYCHFVQTRIDQLSALMSAMQDWYTSCASTSQPVSKADCNKRSFIAAQYSEDDLWYRAQIEEMASDGVMVRFIDHGNSELVSFEKLCFLNEEFSKLPAQAIPCSLAEITPTGPLDSKWSDQIIEKLSELVFDKGFVGHVKSVENVSGMPFKFDEQKTLDIVLIDTADEAELSIGDELVRLGLAEQTHNLISPDIPPLTPTIKTVGNSARDKRVAFTNFLPVSAGDVYKMYASNIVSPSSFWLQVSTADDILAMLQTELADAYRDGKGMMVAKIQVGVACCTKFSEDDGWYRSTVTEVTCDSATVCFVDYGNCETVNINEIFVLQPEFFNTPVQALECSLSTLHPDAGDGTSFTEGVVSEFTNLVFDKPLTVTFNKKLPVNRWLVNLQESNMDVAEQLIEGSERQSVVISNPSVPLGQIANIPVSSTQIEQATPIPSPKIQVVQATGSPNVEMVTIPNLELEVGPTYSVSIIFRDSPSKFFCQLVSESDRLETLMAEIADYYAGHQLEPEIKVGGFCVAQCAVNGLHRALITGVDGNGIEVFLVDYGSTEYISPGQVFGLHSNLSTLPSQAIPCSIVYDLGMEFTSEQAEQFFQCDVEQEFKIKVRAEESKRYIVDLYDQDCTHVNASLLKCVQLAAVPEVKEAYSPLDFSLGTTVDAYISFTNSPTSFYCQPLELAAELDVMMNEIAALMASRPAQLMPASSLRPGAVCLAQFNDDNEWYRAVVSDVFDKDSVSVLFIDYGNTEITTPSHIAVLPEQFLTYSIQAFHCSSFDGLGPGIKWNQEQIIQFQELVPQNDHLTLTISNSVLSNLYSVEISVDGEKVDFSPLLEQLIDGGNASKPQDAANPNESLGLHLESSDITKLSAAAAKGSVSSSNPPPESDTESADTDTDNGSAGEPLIRAPYKLSLAIQEVLEVNVVYVQSPSLLYIQRTDCQAELESLSEELEQYCASFGEAQFSQTFHQGDYVLAKYTANGTWYRAEVTGVDSEDGTTEVSFIDYGNVEIVSPENLIMCPENLLELPAQGIPCSLCQVPRRDSWPFEYREMLDHLVEGKVFKATVVLPASQGMRPTVSLEDVHSKRDLSQQVLLKLQDECETGSDSVITELPEGDDLDDLKDEDLPAKIHLESEGLALDNVEAATGIDNMREVDTLAQREDDTIVSEESFLAEPETRVVLPERKFKVGTFHEVFVVLCASPDSFVCQLAGDSDILDMITERLAQLYTDSENDLEKIPAEGHTVAAQFSEDDLWYRGKILSVENGGRFEIHFIDFGNSESLPLDRLRSLHPALCESPPMAIDCFISGIQPPVATKVFQVETAVKMLELIADNVCCMEMVSIDTAGHLGVHMTTSEGLSVGPMLIESRLAAPLVLSPEELPVPKEDVQGERELLNGLPSKRCENDRPIADLASAGDEQNKAQVPVSLEQVSVDVSPGSEVCASVDQKVPDHAFSQLGDTVAGVPSSVAGEEECPPNDQTSSNDQTVPGDSRNDCCEIQDEDATPISANFTPAGTEAVVDTSSEVETSREPKTTSISSIEIPLSNTDLAQPNSNSNNNNDCDAYSTSLPVQDLIPGIRYQVRLLSVSSLDEFFCQLVEQLADMKNISQGLEETYSTIDTLSPDSLTPGLPVCVCSEKGEGRAWRRGKIVSFNRMLDTAKVYFVDFGDIDIVPRNRIKLLMSKFSNLLPPQAVKCQLPVLCESDLNPDLVFHGELWELAWPSSCLRSLTQLITSAGVGLYLEILQANEGSAYTVKLFDCSNEEETDLRDVLVEQLRAPRRQIDTPSQLLPHELSEDNPTSHESPSEDNPTPHESPSEDILTPHESPSEDILTPHESPSEDNPTSHESPSEDILTPHESPSENILTPHESPSEIILTPYESPLEDNSTPHESPSEDDPTPHESPSEDDPTPHESPSENILTPHGSPSEDNATLDGPSGVSVPSTPTSVPSGDHVEDEISKLSACVQQVSIRSKVSDSPAVSPIIDVKGFIHGNTSMSSGEVLAEESDMVVTNGQPESISAELTGERENLNGTSCPVSTTAEKGSVDSEVLGGDCADRKAIP